MDIFDEISGSDTGDIFDQVASGPAKVSGRTPSYDRRVTDKAEIERRRKEFVLQEDDSLTGKIRRGAKAVAPYVRPALEGGGAAVGSILGAGGGSLAGLAGGPAAPATVPYGAIAGGVAGGATGYAAGKYLADVLEGAPQSAGTTLRDLGRGAAYEMGGQIVGRGVGAIAERAPAAIASLKSPVKTTAQRRAQQTLAATTDLSPQEARNLAQAEQLTNKLGVKLTPAQMTGKPTTAAMEQGLATSDPAFAATLNAQDAAAKDAALKAIRGGVGAGKPVPGAPDLAATGQRVADTVKTASAKAKQVPSDLYKEVPNVQLSTGKIAETVQKLESEFMAGDESVFPTRVIAKIKDTLKTAPTKTPKHMKLAERLGEARYVPEPTTVGFQELHSLRKDIGRQINDAMSGPQPNRELAMKLQQLKASIDETIELNMGANDKYKAAKDSFIDYANRFRTGAVNKVTQRGREASGLNLSDETIPRQFFTPSGATGLVRAVGPGAAKEQMRPFVIADLTKAAAPNGVDFNIKAGRNYLQKNRAALERLGLIDDVRQVLKDQFPAELERRLAKRAPDAATGAQFFTAQDMRGILQEYGSFIKQEFGPQALTAFRDYNLMTMIERKNVIPRGGNSNTAEKAVNLANLMIKESAGPAKRLTDGLAVAIAKGATSGGGVGFVSGGSSVTGAALGSGIMAARQMLQNADSQIAKTFVKILQDATLNPQVAKDLMQLQRTGKISASLQSFIDKQLAAVSAGTMAGVDD